MIKPEFRVEFSQRGVIFCIGHQEFRLADTNLRFGSSDEDEEHQRFMAAMLTKALRHLAGDPNWNEEHE